MALNIEKRIQQRFQELSDKADRLIMDSDDSEQVLNIQEFAGWAVSSLDLLKRVFGGNSLQYRHFEESYEYARDGDIENISMCIGILQSAYKDYENGYLFNIQTLIKAELGDDILEQAKALLHGNYKDIACVVAGIALEMALKDICTQNSIACDSRKKAESLNTDLRKAGVYNDSMKKQITAWLARRNHAAHREWDEYNHADVRDLINGVERFIGEYLS